MYEEDYGDTGEGEGMILHLWRGVASELCGWEGRPIKKAHSYSIKSEPMA